MMCPLADGIAKLGAASGMREGEREREREHKPRYCWAQDAAVDTYGYPRSNYMTIDYARSELGFVWLRGWPSVTKGRMCIWLMHHRVAAAQAGSGRPDTCGNNSFA